MKLISILALTAGLAAPAVLAASPAAATTKYCRVTLDRIVAGNVEERDGKDELRFKVDGNMFPKSFSKKRHVMRSGAVARATAFGKPTTVLITPANVRFHLHEVDGPPWGQGKRLGVAVAHASKCAKLKRGDRAYETTVISGKGATKYSYAVRLKLTRR